MSELGDQPRKRLSMRSSSSRKLRGGKSSGLGHPLVPEKKPVSEKKRGNLWQALFKQGSRRSVRRSQELGDRANDRANGGLGLTQAKPERQRTRAVASRVERERRPDIAGRSLDSGSSWSGSSWGDNRFGFNGRRSRVPKERIDQLPTHPTRRRDRPNSPRPRSMSAALYITRMLILSVGVGVLAGTALSVWDPSDRTLVDGSQQRAAVKQAGIGMGGGQEQAARPNSAQMQPGQEMAALKASIQAAGQKTPQMTPGVFLIDLDTNAYVDLNGAANFSAASTIKVPILIAFLQDVDAGKLRLDEPLVMRKELMAGGSGDMQYQVPGTRYTALETVTKMIVISDNTATNMLMARLGGLRALNQRFRSWGLMTTTINNLLPDLEGTNSTSPRELTMLMARIGMGELLSIRSRDRLLDIMRRTENNSQLPQGLGAGATIAHKTGDIGALIGDVGLVDLPNGKRYAIAVMVKRPFNDDRAYDVVNQISRIAYNYFTRPATGQAPTAPPAPTSPSTSSPQNSPGSSSSEADDTQGQ